MVSTCSDVKIHCAWTLQWSLGNKWHTIFLVGFKVSLRLTLYNFPYRVYLISCSCTLLASYRSCCPWLFGSLADLQRAVDKKPWKNVHTDGQDVLGIRTLEDARTQEPLPLLEERIARFYSESQGSSSSRCITPLRRTARKMQVTQAYEWTGRN